MKFSKLIHYLEVKCVCPGDFELCEKDCKIENIIEKRKLFNDCWNRVFSFKTETSRNIGEKIKIRPEPEQKNFKNIEFGRKNTKKNNQ